MTTYIAPITATITKEQIGRAADRFSVKCFKNAATFPKDIVQDVLENEGDALAQEMFEAFRKRVERRGNTIVRVAKVDRTRTPQAVLDATGRMQYTNGSVVEMMPRGEGEEVEVHFFKVGRYISVGDLGREYESRGLKPDPYAQAQVNTDDPSFADEHPNGSQWRDADGNACYATFHSWFDDRKVYVLSRGVGWDDGWWFAGVRK